MPDYIIKGAQLINEGKIFAADLLIKRGRIERIDPDISVQYRVTEVNADTQYLIPGIIDDQVHFREPGLTDKATIHSEARAGIAGAVTSFMEMPNTKPAALTRTLLEDKYEIANRTSLANYSFYMGVSNDNFSEVQTLIREQRQAPVRNICGLKIFMGSSTGNMLVDNPSILEQVFAESNLLIATHCEDETRVRERNAAYMSQYGDRLDASFHPIIRDDEACYLSSSLAVSLARKHGSRLHVLHISTARELELFSNEIPLKNKLVTAEACVHHLWFDADDYVRLGNKIKCNPAIKAPSNKTAIIQALLDNRIDVIATDHAPHTIAEKALPYIDAPAGLPLIQHSLNIMLELFHQGRISLERIVEKMCHAPADLFAVSDRGYLREGYQADLALIDTTRPWQVNKDNILFKCGWSPFEGYQFQGQVHSTFVNGHRVYHNGIFDESQMGARLEFHQR